MYCIIFLSRGVGSPDGLPGSLGVLEYGNGGWSRMLHASRLARVLG